MVHRGELSIATRGRGTYDITRDVATIVGASSARTGLATVFIHHTSAGLTINENADPTVRLDFETVFNKLVPEGWKYVHNDEGPDDMPAHIKASLVGSSVSFPVKNGKPLLGTWQGIYLCEFRDDGGRRKITVTVLS